MSAIFMLTLCNSERSSSYVNVNQAQTRQSYRHSPFTHSALPAGRQNESNLVNHVPLSNAKKKSTPHTFIIVTLFTNLSIECHLYMCKLSQIITIKLRTLFIGFKLKRASQKARFSSIVLADFYFSRAPASIHCLMTSNSLVSGWQSAVDYS